MNTIASDNKVGHTPVSRIEVNMIDKVPAIVELRF